MLQNLVLMSALFSAAALPQTETPNTDMHYKLAPDALVEEGVPKGEVRGPFTLPSEAYPGTQHTYWIYVPAQYDPAVPASLMIYNDGQAFMNPDWASCSIFFRSNSTVCMKPITTFSILITVSVASNSDS